MSYPTRSLAVGVGGTSSASSSSGPQSAHLLARIREKKAELDNLVQLRELSAAVAAEMEKLEQKLGTLSDGTEAIATVVANWNSVLQAINMASGAFYSSRPPSQPPSLIMFLLSCLFPRTLGFILPSIW